MDSDQLARTILGLFMALEIEPHTAMTALVEAMAVTLSRECTPDKDDEACTMIANQVSEMLTMLRQGKVPN